MIKFDFQGLTSKENVKVGPDDFKITKVQPDMDAILGVAGKHGNIKNIIVIGRGGSISTFRAFWQALGKYISDKKVYIVDTVDPDYIFYVKDRCTPADSLVVAISKSGNTVDMIENVLAFLDFPQVVITTNNDNPLKKIAEDKGFDIIPHQEIGGRYSGLTEVGLFPSVLAGIDISEVRKGAREAYEAFTADQNDAKTLAGIIAGLNEKKYDEIFWPIYSKKLVGFSELIAQLMNESLAKDEKGLSIIAAEGPESQHFLNQRFFGGQKNMIGLFTSVEKFDEEETIQVPGSVKDTFLRDGTVGTLDGINLSDSMKFELQGTFEHAKRQNIPVISLQIEKVDEYHLGYFTAFLHCLTIYLALALKVNPFDQPEVEGSKVISFEARKGYKK